MVPRTTMEKDLKNQEKSLTDDINSLNKKVSFLIRSEMSSGLNRTQVKFLEKQFNDAQSQLRDIVSALAIPHIALIRDSLSLIARQDNRALRVQCPTLSVMSCRRQSN